jgi:hypothetical protein
MRRRRYSARDVAMVREVFAARRALTVQLNRLPTLEKLAAELGCSVAMVKKIGYGQAYKDAPDVADQQPHNG